MGRVIGEQAQTGDIFLLTGPLGAGKTCLTQGVAWGVGVVEYACSPTFVLMTRYRGRLTFHHVDLYRINDPLEAWDMGLEEELFGDGITVVEWADRAEEIFPEQSLWIALDYARNAGASLDSPLQEERSITLVNPPPRFAGLVGALSKAFPPLEVSG